MNGYSYTMTPPINWEIKSPSKEYINLPGSVRADIDGYLSERPV